MGNDYKDMSLDGLFGRLHRLMSDLAADLDSIVGDNKDMDGVRELRDHISRKLDKGEEIDDNKRLLKLLDLFSKDKAVIEIIREDADDWIKLLNAIEGSIKADRPELTSREEGEIKEIGRLTSEIKALVRK
ncbi:MAG: hypothetical protein ACREBH_02590 [Candidatus Micrarchaeaceae archaeon]